MDQSLQYNTIQYNTVQYNTIQYNTIQYNTIQILLLDQSLLTGDKGSVVTNNDHQGIHVPTISIAAVDTTVRIIFGKTTKEQKLLVTDKHIHKDKVHCKHNSSTISWRCNNDNSEELGCC